MRYVKAVQWHYDFPMALRSFAPLADADSRNVFNSFMRWSISYRNQSIDLLGKSMNWFVYDRDLRHGRVNRVKVGIKLDDWKKTLQESSLKRF